MHDFVIPEIQEFISLPLVNKLQVWNRLVDQLGKYAPTWEAVQIAVDVTGECPTLLTNTECDTWIDTLKRYESGREPDFYETVELFKTYIAEYQTLLSSYAVTQQLNKQGICKQMTDLQNIIPHGSIPSEGLKRDTTQVIGSGTEVSKSLLREGRALSMAEYDGDRTTKRKKVPKHLPNMKQRDVKAVMGASILKLLGKVQSDTLDSRKKAVLKELPLADVIEASSGKPVPDWQANLMNQNQAKADPEAPVVQRMRGGSLPIAAIDEAAFKGDEPTSKRGETSSMVNYDDSAYQPAKTIEVTIDPDDPDPKSTVAVVLQSYADDVPLQLTKGVLTVGQVGLGVRDILVKYKDETRVYTFEQYVESVANHLKTTVEVVTEKLVYPRIFKQAVVTMLDLLTADDLEFDKDDAKSDFVFFAAEKVLLNYVIGYLKGTDDVKWGDINPTPYFGINS